MEINRTLRSLAFLFLAFLASSVWSAPLVALPVSEAFQVSVHSDKDSLVLKWRAAPDHHLYRDQMYVERSDGIGVTRLNFNLPAGSWRDDPDFGHTAVLPPSGESRLVSFGTGRIRVHFQGCADAGLCYPPQVQEVVISAPSVPLAPLPNTATTISWMVFLMAFMGGLVLNVLPCVLPVLALKVSSVLDHPGSSASRHRLEAYALGVVLTFLLLGGILAIVRPEGLGWGFQLQSPTFVGLLFGGFLLMATAMLGLWEMPSVRGSWINKAISRQGWMGDMLAGVLAVVVASPCVGPFLGAALAVALLAPPFEALLLFASMGLGLAAPALVLAWVPYLRSRLPRPGAWMNKVRQLLSIPLFLAALWLGWVLTQQVGGKPVMLVALGCLSLVVVLARRAPYSSAGAFLVAHPRVSMFATYLPVLVVVSGLMLPVISPPAVQSTASASNPFTPVPDRVFSMSKYGALEFSPSRLTTLRQSGKTIFVSIGADWCLTCKANDLAVLERPEFRENLDRSNVVWLAGDWTKPDPEIASFLQGQGAVGVPLYLVFKNGKVQVLPQILTPDVIRRALFSGNA